MVKKKHKQKHHNAKEGESRVKVIRELPREERKLIDEREIAMDFATRVHKRFDRMIKASILFGSQAKNTAKPGSDIDIILIIDDASINWDLELIAWYREELGKLITEQKYGKDLHINTIKLTTWWQDLSQGDPVVLNVLRHGEGLIDIGGFFSPLKALMVQGKINSTPEAIYMALQRSPTHLVRSKLAILNSIEGVYWTMVEVAQAALMATGKLPQSPEQLPQLLKTTFVDSGMMKIDRVRELRDIYILHKGILHHEVHEVKGAEIDKWQSTANSFLLEMTRLIDQLIDQKK